MSSKQIEITRNNPLGFACRQVWAKTDLFCPACGKATVWHEDEAVGDYYVGESHICTSCGSDFTIPTLDVIGPGGYRAEVLTQLRAEALTHADTEASH